MRILPGIFLQQDLGGGEVLVEGCGVWGVGWGGGGGGGGGCRAPGPSPTPLSHVGPVNLMLTPLPPGPLVDTPPTTDR